MRPLEIALGCWLIGSGFACIVQLLLPGRVAAGSAWGLAVGWQREVAAWNFALCVAILRVLFLRDEACQILLGHIIIALAVALGANHMAAARQCPTYTHTVGILANCAGILLVVWGLLMSK